MQFVRNSKIINKKYREFFIPALLMAIASTFSIIVDGMIVGALLGSNELAAVNTCLPAVQLYNTLAMLIGLGAAVLISIAKGRRESEESDSVFTSSIILMLAVSAVLTAVQAIFADSVINMLTSDSILKPLSAQYFKALMYGTPLIIFVNGLSYIIRTEGYANLSSAVIIVANAAKIILDIVFISPCKMGIAGAALATVAGYALSLPIIFVYLFKKRTLGFKFKNLLKSSGSILKTGCAGALGGILISVKLLFINNIVTKTAGKSGMVAFSLCLSCLLFISIFILGASQTMMPILGIVYGEHDYSGVKYVTRYAFGALGIATVVVTALFEAFPSILFKLYNITSAADIAVATPALRIYSLSFIGVSASFLLMYYYMSTEKRKEANIIAVLEGLAVVVPCAFILSKVMGIKGVWLSFIIAEAVTAAYVFIRAKGKISNIFMIEKPSETIKEFSLEPQDGTLASEEIISFLCKYGLSRDSANKIGLAVEEMAENIKSYSVKKANIDICLRAYEKSVVLIITDNAKDFDPTVYRSDESGKYDIDNISMLRAIASDISYQRIIGLNKTVISFNR